MNTDVPGSPESCRATAEALDRLADHLERADRLAARGARTPESDFDGRTADSYRGACAELAANASAHATSTRHAAGALASYADELGAVQRVMERVRRSAGVHGLLHGTELVPPAAPTPHQNEVFDRLIAIGTDALAHLERARDRLGEAFPGHPFPADYGNVLLPPEPGTSGPLPFPPPESAWPTERRDDDPRPPEQPRGDGDRTEREHRPQPDRGSEPEGPTESPEDPPEDSSEEGAGDAPRREAPPAPNLRFHYGGPVGGGDPPRWHCEVLRPAPEPVP